MRKALTIIALVLTTIVSAGAASASASYDEMIQLQAQVVKFEDLALYDPNPANIWQALIDYQFYQEFVADKCYTDWQSAIRAVEDAAGRREFELRRRIEVQRSQKIAALRELRLARIQIRALTLRIAELESAR